MDKQQIAKEILNKYKIQGYVPKDRQSVDLDSRFAEIDAIASGQVSETGQKKRSFAEKVADFTGGKEIAQGIGQSLAQGGNVKRIEETQKQQFSIQSNLLSKIKEKKALGEDTSRLENALDVLNEEIQKTGTGAEKILNPNQLTEKQVIGDALQLATTLGTIGGISGAGASRTIAGKTIPGLTKSAPGIAQTLAGKVTGGGVGVLRGGAQGALAGAGQGAVSGALLGTSQGLQEDLTGKEIAEKAISSGVTGLIGGGIVGGVLGGASGAIKANKLAKKDAYLEAITPNTKDLTPTEYEDLLNRGKITPKTSTSPAKYILSEGEKNVAKKYKDIFTNDPVKNTENIIDEISKKDKEVGKFLKDNNGIFNTGELKNSLKKQLADIDDLTIDEKRLTKLKQSTIDNFIKGLKKNDMETLWKARKEFDRSIEKSFSGSPTLQNTIKKEFRNAIQDFIADRTPSDVYKSSMKEMSDLFNLKDVVNTKAVKEKGLNAIQVWIKRNPTKAKLIGWTAGTGIVGTVGASILKD